MKINVRLIFILLSLFTKTIFSLPCTQITSLPFTITSFGNYCLAGNLVNNSDLNAITISASGVTLDLQQFIIDDYSAKTDKHNFGIFCKNCRDVTIKNGIIRGFMYGIYLADDLGSDSNPASLAGGNIIDKMTIVNSSFRGIRIEGVHNIIKNSTITGIGGTTVFPNSYSIGIESIGPGTEIKNNTVSEFYAIGTGESVGISFSNNSSGCSATDNIIVNKKRLEQFPFSQGSKFGIWVGGNFNFVSNVFVRNNSISNMTYGVTFASPTIGWYGNNRISNSQLCNYFIGSQRVSTFNFNGVRCDKGDMAKIEHINRMLSDGNY